MTLLFKNIKVLPLVYYPGSFNKNLKYSNKAIVPQKILDRLIKQFNDELQYPLIFKIKTNILNFYIGVEEFCSQKDTVYIPIFILHNNFVVENTKVTIEYCSIPKGSFIKLKPHKTSFTKLPNPKELLETKIINYYPVLTKNQTISIKDKNVEYLIDVTDCEPFYVISTNETDISVDFEEPYDYQQVLKKQNEQIKHEQIKHEQIKHEHSKQKRKCKFKKKGKFVPFTGKSYRLCDT